MAGSETPGPLGTSPHHTGPGTAVQIAIILMLTLVAGVVLWMVTDATSRTDVGGQGWSLKGNGALAMPFALGPAVLTSAWVAISLAGVSGARWGHIVLAGLAAFLLAFAVVFGPFLPLGFWPALFAPVLALAVGHSLASTCRAAAVSDLAVGVVLVGLFMAGVLSQPVWTAWAYQLAPLVVPVALALPLGMGVLSEPGSRVEHVGKLGGCLLVPLAFFAGLVGTAWIIAALAGTR